MSDHDDDYLDYLARSSGFPGLDMPRVISFEDALEDMAFEEGCPEMITYEHGRAPRRRVPLSRRLRGK